MTVDPAAAASAFAANFREHGEVGASLAIWCGESELLSIGEGFQDRAKTIPWQPETPVLVWSATKGPAAACLIHALEQSGRDLEEPAGSVWPALGGTFGDVLAHAAGLPALDEKVDALDHEAVVAALERQIPAWSPGTAHGYHPRTYGYLLDELVRRITGGVPLGRYWRLHFGEPMGLDFWIGVPPEVVESVAPILPPRAGEGGGEKAFYAALADPASLTAKAFASPIMPGGVSAMNRPEIRQHALPAFGGIGTAAALAQFYAMLAQGGMWRGERYFSEPTLRAIETVRFQGEDRILRLPTAFGPGFMRDPCDDHGRKLRATFGPSLRAFGQPGAGGSLAFADPENGLGFAYVMNQMGVGVLPNVRATRIVEALYG